MPVPNVTSRRPRPGRARIISRPSVICRAAPKATEIADRMGVRRVKLESLCLGCHFHGAGEGRQERTYRRHLLRDPATAAGRIGSRSTAGSAARRRRPRPRPRRRRAGSSQTQGNDQAARDLSAREELLRLPRRAARGAREQRRAHRPAAPSIWWPGRRARSCTTPGLRRARITCRPTRRASGCSISSASASSSRLRCAQSERRL